MVNQWKRFTDYLSHESKNTRSSWTTTMTLLSLTHTYKHKHKMRWPLSVVIVVAHVSTWQTTYKTLTLTGSKYSLLWSSKQDHLLHSHKSQHLIITSGCRNNLKLVQPHEYSQRQLPIKLPTVLTYSSRTRRTHLTCYFAHTLTIQSAPFSCSCLVHTKSL